MQTYINSINIEKTEEKKDLFPFVSIGFITLTTVGITIHFIGKSVGGIFTANDSIGDLNNLIIPQENKEIDISHIELIDKIHTNALSIFSTAKSDALKNLMLRASFTAGSIIIAIGAATASKPFLMAGGVITITSFLGMIIKEGIDKIYDTKFIQKINNELNHIESFLKILEENGNPPLDRL